MCDQPTQKKIQRTKNNFTDITVNLKQKGIKIKPGWKLFHQCINQYEKIMKEPEEIAIDENETETEEVLQAAENGADYEESTKKKLNTCLVSDGVSSINFHAVSQHRRVNKLKIVIDKLKSVIEKY